MFKSDYDDSPKNPESFNWNQRGLIWSGFYELSKFMLFQNKSRITPKTAIFLFVDNMFRQLPQTKRKLKKVGKSVRP